MAKTAILDSTTPVPVRQRRKRPWVLLLLTVFAAIAVASIYFYKRHQAERALDDAIAETDQLDPQWRLEEIEKRRTALPMEENAAVHINAAVALGPRSWASWTNDGKGNKGPRFQFEAAELAALRVALEPFLPAAEMARKAGPLQSGWYAVPLDFERAPDSHAMEVQNLGKFLYDLAVLQNHDGCHDDAWQTALTILAAGRSFGEEPVLISQLVRASLRAQAAGAMEMCLARGTVDDLQLAAAQQQLAEDATQPLFYFALRGERAGMHRLLSGLENGTIAPDIVFQSTPGGMAQYRVKITAAGGSFKNDHAWMLQFYNEAVEQAKLSPFAMRITLRALDKKRKDQAPPLAKGLVMDLGAGWCDTFVQSRSRLECAVAGIAVERYRLMQGRWPNSLSEVVAAKLLDKVPADPFDGQPLHYRKTTDGAVVYSAGPTGKYAGNALDAGRQSTPGAERCEFRLWNEKQR